jgi:hypothetical protein
MESHFITTQQRRPKTEKRSQRASAFTASGCGVVNFKSDSNITVILFGKTPITNKSSAHTDHIDLNKGEKDNDRQ